MNKPENNLKNRRNKRFTPLKTSNIKFPEEKIKAAQWVHLLIWSLLGIIFLFSVVSILWPQSLWNHFNFTDYPLHSTVEALGAIAAILIAFMPLQVLFGKYKPSFVFLSTGFLVMGLLDLFHSFFKVGHGFVFTHALALLAGGFFFALFVFPWKINVDKAKKYILFFFGLVTILFAVVASLNREAFPEMIHDGVFTSTANMFNMLAGLLFLISAIKLFVIYIKEKNLGVLILFFTAIISALVGITFQYSDAWSDGWWLWHAIRLIAFLSLLGYMFWRIQAVSHERNEALDSIKEKHNQLQASEERFSLVNEATKQGLWDWNVPKNEVYFSPVWKMQVGYKDDELENDFANWAKLLHPEDKEHSLKAIDDYLKNPEGKFILEFRFQHKDGHYVWIHNQAATVKDNDGNVLRMFGAHTDITAQKEAEEIIAKSENMLKSAQQIAKVGNWELDIVNNKLYWSDEIYRIFGLQPQEFDATYEAFLEHIHPDDRDAVNEAYAKSLETKEPYEIVHRVLLKDGTIKYVKEKCDTDFDDDRNPLRSVGIVQDITAEKRNEEILKQEKEFSDSVINAMPGVFYLFNENGKFLKWNNTMEKLSGSTPEEMSKKSSIDVIAPYHQDKVAKAIQTAFETGYVTVEADFNSKDEAPIPHLFSGKIINPKDEPLLVGIGIDITKRLKAEQEKEKALYHLNERMKEITCLFEINEAIKNPEISIPEVMDKITHSIPKGWQHPKKTCTRVILEKQEFKSKNFKESNIFIEESIILGEKNIGKIQVFVFDLPREQEKSPFLNEEKQLLSTIANNVGIYVNRVESVKELNKTMEKLQLSNKELERFAYVASHDLQEPLRMVSSYTQLLERRYKGQMDERADKYIYYAVDGANRMQNLINDLLDFSRISTRGEKFTTTDTSEALKNTLSNLENRINETGAQIKTGKLPVIKADSGQIERLFLNLIGNALKFSKPDEKPVVEIDAKSQKDKWLFTVKDNGIGIDEKFKEKVFVIFQRLHGASQYKGTGIGLAICKRIVQRHEGEIWFESEENKGTTFYFTLKKHKLGTDKNE